MNNLQEYINDLINLSDNIDKVVSDTVYKNKGYFLQKIKLRLFQKGLDADLKSLGPYQPDTIKRKKAQGKRTSHVTLRDEGDFYDSMFITYEDQNVIVESSDPKADELMDVYGEAILGLTDEELDMFIDVYLEQEVNKHLNREDSDLNLGEL